MHSNRSIQYQHVPYAPVNRTRCLQTLQALRLIIDRKYSRRRPMLYFVGRDIEGNRLVNCEELRSLMMSSTTYPIPKMMHPANEKQPKSCGPRSPDSCPLVLTPPMTPLILHQHPRLLDLFQYLPGILYDLDLLLFSITGAIREHHSVDRRAIWK